MAAERWSRGARFVTAMAAAVALTLVALPRAALADDSLVRADPGAGVVLAAAPARITLRFGAKVSGDDSHVTVSTAAGKDVATGVDQDTADSLRVPVSPDEPGDFTVAYHVIFLDGGSVTGAYRFSAGTGKAPAPLSWSAQQAATAAVAQHVHQVDGASAVLLVIDGAVALGVLFLLWARPRRGRGSPARNWRYRDDRLDV